MGLALLRPALLPNIPAFDATQPYTFIFTVAEGGTQITGNILTIRNNSTNQIVYNQTQTTYQYRHVLPADTLTNGTNYNVTVTTLDIDGNQSPISIPVQFWCYTTPVMTITNIPASSIINSSSFNFEFTYTQNENEKLNSYEVNLYSISNQLLASSGVLYAVDGAPPFSSSYLFSGFDTGTPETISAYRIEVIGYTINNTQFSSGLSDFTVQYAFPSIYSLVSLVNNCSGGYITLRSNLLSIEGIAVPDPPTYVDGHEIDLTGGGNLVEWHEGYSISGDMLTRLWFRDPNPNTTIMEFSNVLGDKIEIRYNEGYVDDDNTTTKLAYISVNVTNHYGTRYFIYSDYITILNDNQYYNLWMRRINDVYQLEFAQLVTE